MNSTESRIQQDCIVWFKNSYCLKFHKPRCVVFSVPNEEIGEMTVSQRRKAISKKLQIGMLPGASDFIVVMPGEAVFFETKTETGTQSNEQKDFQQVVSGLGFQYHVIRSLEQFKEIIHGILQQSA